MCIPVIVVLHKLLTLSGVGQFCLYQVLDCPPLQEDLLEVYADTVIQKGMEAVNQSE